MPTTLQPNTTVTVIYAPLSKSPQINTAVLEAGVELKGLYVLDDGRYFTANPAADSPFTVHLQASAYINGSTVAIAGLHGGLNVINDGTIGGSSVGLYLDGTASQVTNLTAGIIGLPKTSNVSGNITVTQQPVGVLLDGGTVTNFGHIAAQLAVYGSGRSWQVGKYSTAPAAEAGPTTVDNFGGISGAVAISLQIENSEVYNGRYQDPNNHSYTDPAKVFGLVAITGGTVDNLGDIFGIYSTVANSPTLLTDLAVDLAGPPNDSNVVINGENDSNIPRYEQRPGLIIGAVYSSAELKLTNQGVIELFNQVGDGDTNANQAAVNAGHGGTIDNMTGADIYGNRIAVEFATYRIPASETAFPTVVLKGVTGTLINAGYLKASAPAGQVIVADYSDDTVTNSGTILASGGSGQGVNLSFGGSVDNSGLLQSSYFGVVAYGGASLVSDGSSRQLPEGQFDYDNAVIVTNSGTILGETGVLFGQTGTATAVSYVVNHQLYAAEYTQRLAASSAQVTNTGIIAGTSTGGQGVVFAGPSSTLDNAGLISGTTNAVLETTGTLSATNAAAGTILVTGTDAQAIVMEGGGSLANAGLIQGTYSGDLGVVFSTDATVSNTGTIDAYLAGIYASAVAETIVPAQYGATYNNGNEYIYLMSPAYTLNTPGSIDNSGVVTVTGSSGVAVELLGGGTLSNSGTIAGGTAGQAGVLLGAGTLSGIAASVFNDGTISGAVGLEVAIATTSSPSLARVSITNTGVITGYTGDRAATRFRHPFHHAGQ